MPDTGRDPYPNSEARERSKALDDPRFGCWFCGADSVAIAPRHSGGDTDVPVHYVPVCTTHAADWYDDVPDDLEIGMIPRDGVFLPTEQAEVVLAALQPQDDAPMDDAEFVGQRRAIESAIHSIDAGLRSLRLF